MALVNSTQDHYSSLEQIRTVVIPVEKRGDIYTVSVVKELWNEFQLLILSGAKERKIILEFDIKN